MSTEAGIDEVFLIKENGICYAHAGRKSIYEDDLRSSLIIAMDCGTADLFGKKVKCIILEDGKKVIYHRCEINKIKFNLIAVIKPGFDKYDVLDLKISNFKKFLEKERIFDYLDSENSIKDDERDIIGIVTRKIEDFFLNGIELAISRREESQHF